MPIAVVMMFDARDGWPDTPAFLRLYVADCDQAYQRALGAGATSVTEPTSLYFGDRVCRAASDGGSSTGSSSSRSATPRLLPR